MSLKQTERLPAGSKIAWETVLAELPFNSDGLIPAIAQQYDTGEVLMMAWMNRDTLQETIESKQVCYWSRSRQQRWRKGESSGQTQQLRELLLDCDGDTLLLKVDQVGAACHSGRRSCFYNAVRGDFVEVLDNPLVDPDTLYAKNK